jgi:hypothetical protein
VARRLTYLFVAVAAATALGSASLLAQAADLPLQSMPLRDPTQPADAAAPEGDDAPSSGLQSIIRPMNNKSGAKSAGKPRAIIDGMLVGVGDKVGDATLIAIGVDHVILKNADGTHETMSLTPGVDKTPVRKSSSSYSSNVSRKP